MIIDTHTHAWPEKVARKARKELESFFKVRMVASPTLKSLLRFMDKNRINASVVCAVATRPEQVPGINNWLFRIRSGRMKVFSAMHPDYPLWQQELRRIRRHGDGIKLQPEFQNFYVDDARIFPLYAGMERLGLPLLFHCGEELSGTQLVRSSPQRLLKVKSAFPKLKIIAAHFGGFRFWGEVKKYLLGKEIYLDTAFFFGYLPKAEIRQMILAHRPECLLFGTDFPLVDQKKDISFLENLDLPSSLKEKIFFQNARQLLKF